MYRQDQKDIFIYHDGIEVKCTDPMEIELALEEHSPEWRTLFSAAQVGNAEATKEILKLSRVMFKLPEPVYDESTQTVKGLTGAGVIGVLTDYILKVEEWKKKLEPSPTSLPSTDALPTLTTKPISDVG